MKNTNTIIKNVYGSEEKKTATFIAWLTNQYLYLEKDGKFRIIPQSRLVKVVEGKYDRGEYREADEIVRHVQEAQKKEERTEQISSKSIRVSFPQLLRITREAQERKCTRSDIVRKRLSSRIREVLKQLGGHKRVSKEKLEFLKETLKKWHGKEEKTPRKGSRRETSISFPLSESIDLVTEYTKYAFVETSIRRGIPREIAERFWVELDPYSTLMDSDGVYGYIRIKHSELKISLEPDYYSHGAYHLEHPSLSEKEASWIADIICKDKTGGLRKEGRYPFEFCFEDEGLSDKEIFDKERVNQKILSMREQGEDCAIYVYSIGFDAYTNLPTIVGKIAIGNERQILFNALPLTDKEKLIDRFFLELAKNKVRMLSTKKGFKGITTELEKKARKSLKENDYAKLWEYNRKLAFLDCAKKLAEKLVEKLISCVQSSHVLTFTIPTPLRRLLDAAKEQISIEKLFIEEE